MLQHFVGGHRAQIDHEIARLGPGKYARIFLTVSEARRWYLRAEDMVRFSRNTYWAFEAEKDYDGAIAIVCRSTR